MCYAILVFLSPKSYKAKKKVHLVSQLKERYEKKSKTEWQQKIQFSMVAWFLLYEHFFLTYTSNKNPLMIIMQQAKSRQICAFRLVLYLYKYSALCNQFLIKYLIGLWRVYKIIDSILKIRISISEILSSWFELSSLSLHSNYFHFPFFQILIAAFFGLSRLKQLTETNLLKW